MKAIFEEIKNAIRESEPIRKCALNSIAHWKRNQFIQLATIISEELSKSPLLKGKRIYELGTSISYITLKRFYEDSYRESAINDLRFLKTIHKLCIFLGYFDFNEYIINNQKIKSISTCEDHFTVYKDLVYNFCNKEVEAIKKLPEIDITFLKPYVFEESKLLEKTKNYLKKYKEAGFHYDMSYEQPSFELLSCELISDDEEMKIIKTHEHWDMVLKTNTDKTLIYKVINNQIYYIKKEGGDWKIWDNFNPDSNKILSASI